MLIFLGKVHTIGCFVCSSRNGSNPNCEDPFHPGYSNSSYKDKCKVPKRNHVGEFPAHFCIKVIGKSCKNTIIKAHWKIKENRSFMLFFYEIL